MNLTLNFVDPKVIDQRLIEAENLKSQATREEDFEKAAYFRDQIAKYKEMQKKKSQTRILLSSARKL
ncbi:UvrB/UvrC motif-containing protein, partial [Enterobacter hormaechei]|uniref:UvrB/UvrC motif-containing protein n=1 Tax=Enterobacter hormaechei TaxID=158836 RepID=UPI00203B001D